jgi:hypothetical protein
MKLSKKFTQLLDSLTTQEKAWRALIEDVAPPIKLPEPYANVSAIQRLCILKVLRPDKLIKGIQDFV